MFLKLSPETAMLFAPFRCTHGDPPTSPCPALSAHAEPISKHFLGDRFCVSRKGRTGGIGWVHLKGANSMAVSGLSFRNTLVGSGWAISVLQCTNGLRNSPLASFPAEKLFFPVWTSGYQPRAVNIADSHTLNFILQVTIAEGWEKKL